VIPTLWRSRVARLVALAMVVALCPLPVFAGPPGSPEKATPIRNSAATIAATVRLEPAPVAAQATAGAPGTNSPSFFTKPIGIAVLATLAAGVGYALYSTQHDRVHSPGAK
jgi:hypothetical protein